MDVTPDRQTRGFLFADLRDFSRFTERYGDDAATALLARYRAMVRAEVARFDGAEIRTEGDSFYIVFTSVGAAVRAGVAILSAAARESVETGQPPIRVGIGLHAGETADGEQGIVGSAVNIAARVCSAAGPGQLLVTETVRGLTRGYLPVRFIPIGTRRLKGIAEPVPLFRVDESAGIADDPPAPSPWSGRRAIIGASVAAVAGLAILAGMTGSFDGLLARQPIGGPSPSGSVPVLEQSEGASPSAPGATSSSSLEPSGVFPTAAETTLLEQLSFDSSACVRADVDELPTVPEFYRDAYRPMDVAASVRCPMTGTGSPAETLYFVPIAARPSDPEHPGGHDEVNVAFLSLVGRRGIPPGDCGTAVEAHGEWSLGPQAGRILCYVSSRGAATLLWTIEAGRSPILAQAIGRDADLGRLMDWWRATGRLIIGR